MPSAPDDEIVFVDTAVGESHRDAAAVLFQRRDRDAETAGEAVHGRQEAGLEFSTFDADAAADILPQLLEIDGRQRFTLGRTEDESVQWRSSFLNLGEDAQ
jgi:hypothetical protein